MTTPSPHPRLGLGTRQGCRIRVGNSSRMVAFFPFNSYSSRKIQDGRYHLPLYCFCCCRCRYRQQFPLFSRTLGPLFPLFSGVIPPQKVPHKPASFHTTYTSKNSIRRVKQLISRPSLYTDARPVV